MVYKKNDIIKFDNFVSTTFDPTISLIFAGKFEKEKGNSTLLIIRVKKDHNIPAVFISNIFDNNPNNEQFKFNWKHTTSEEYEILLSRNVEFIIKNIKIIQDKDKKTSSLSDLYNKHKYSKYIKLVFLESLPFKIPEPFEPEHKYKYVCVKDSQ